jgi:hypothetical protein
VVSQQGILHDLNQRGTKLRAQEGSFIDHNKRSFPEFKRIGQKVEVLHQEYSDNQEKAFSGLHCMFARRL